MAFEIPSFFHHRAKAPAGTAGVVSAQPEVAVTKNSRLTAPEATSPDYGIARPLTGALTTFHPPTYGSHRVIIICDSVDPARSPTRSDWRPRLRV